MIEKCERQISLGFLAATGAPAVVFEFSIHVYVDVVNIVQDGVEDWRKKKEEAPP